MNTRNNPKLRGFAQNLRKNMTKEEKQLWYDCLKKLPFTVNRQKVIGNYIADFYIAEAKLIIELDGFQHYKEKGKASDVDRDRYFNDLGLTVLRYSNYQIHREFENVCADIYAHIAR